MISLLLLALTLMGPPARGGHATLPPPRGGHAEPVLESIGNIDNWICIHEGEGAWNAEGGTYWGGLQMDIDFQQTWGPDMIRKYGGWAHLWTPRDQMVVAERARKVRGYYPWPQTARVCGLI